MQIESKGRLVWAPFIVFVLIGGLLLAVDEMGARIVGAVILLLFGGAGLAFFALTRPHRVLTDRQLRDRIEEGPVRGAAGVAKDPREPGVKLLASRAAFFPVVLGSVGFAVASLAMILRPILVGLGAAGIQFLIVGVTGFLFFGTTAVLAVRGLLRRSGLALLPQGLLSIQPTGRAFVPWDDLEAISEISQQGPGQVQHYLVLEFAEPGTDGAADTGSRVRITGLLAKLRRLQRALYGFDVSIGQRLPLSNREVVQLVGGLAQDPALRSRLRSRGASDLVMELAREPPT